MARAAKNRPSLLACALGAVVAGAWLVAAPRALAQDAAIPAFKTLDSMEARVQGCTTCHGQSGQGTGNDYFPRIAGKPAGYLYNQLVAFRDGKRRYAPMNYLVAYLPDAYLREIAEHYAKQRPPFVLHESVPADAASLDRGQALARTGDPKKGIPACVSCHGANLTGMEPGIPGLVGLRPNYVAAQLVRWRTGERVAAEPDCMKRIAARLTDADITAFAAWLARQKPPADAVAREVERRAHAARLRQPAITPCASSPSSRWSSSAD